MESINEKVNHTFITERDLNKEIKESFFSIVNDFLKQSYDILDALDEDISIDEIIKSNIDYKTLFDNITKFGSNTFDKKKKNVTYSDFFDTLYQQPLNIAFNLKLGGVPLENQSMGQRAIVLLKIILALDDRTLIIDQPEEDLDNRYIYEQLVSSLREAKRKDR